MQPLRAKNRYKVTAVHSIGASARARKFGGEDVMNSRRFMLTSSLPFVASRSSGFSSRLADLPPRKDPSYAWRLADNTLVAVQMLAQFLQRGLTQNMRTALASPCKLDNLLRDNAVREIVGKPERYASHFERDSQNPLSFGIRIQLL